MDFEWDAAKSRNNLNRHGISFAEACLIWQGLHIRVDNVAKTIRGEVRHAIVGELKEKIWIVFWTRRREKIRIISARRARDAEKQAYYEKIQNS